jgi:hypothetical protein
MDTDEPSPAQPKSNWVGLDRVSPHPVWLRLRRTGFIRVNPWFPFFLLNPTAGFSPKTEVKSRRAQGARPSGRFNVHLASGSNTHQTKPTMKRRERRAPAIRPRSQVF